MAPPKGGASLIVEKINDASRASSHTGASSAFPALPSSLAARPPNAVE
jgi:hypothetical protein